MRKAKPENETELKEPLPDAIQTNGAATLPRRRGRPRKNPAGAVSLQGASLADAQKSLGLVTSRAGLDLTEKVRELLRLAKEQGHLTYEDVNDALPDDIVTPEDLDKVLTKLRNLEIDIIDPAEVDRTRQPEAEDEQESSRFDIL